MFWSHFNPLSPLLFEVRDVQRLKGVLSFLARVPVPVRTGGTLGDQGRARGGSLPAEAPRNDREG